MLILFIYFIYCTLVPYLWKMSQIVLDLYDEYVQCGVNIIIQLTQDNPIIINKINLMSTNKYVQQTLTMPENMPLFNYQLNFQGLRGLIENINIQANSNSQQIKAIKQQLETKLHHQKLHEQEQMLNHSLKLGIASEKLIQESQTFGEKQGRKQPQQMTNMEHYGHKMNKVTKIIQHLIGISHQNKSKIQSDEHKHQKNIDDSFRRIDDKVTSSIDSMMKNINLYFTETNKKISFLETELSTHKRESSANFETVNNQLNQRVSDAQLKAALKGLEEQIKSSILGDLSNDQMKRLATINEYSNKLQQHIKQSEIKIKSAKQNVKQLSEKVAKSLPLQSFEIQKHKIFQKLSEYKSKIDDLNRKNQQFVDFRKSVYEANQKVKHNLMDLQDQIKKMGEKGSSFKKIQDVSSILEKLDPHLICQIGSQVKLHEKQLGKLQKQVAYLQNELQSSKNNSSKMPEVNNGQTADTIMKIIKQYMTNLDFEGRVKRAQKDIHDVSKRSDGVNQLEKKIFMLSKQIDVGAIMKQIKKKSDQQITRRDFKIMDSKIQKLFQFYKQVRRELEQLYKKSTRVTKQTGDNASLTTKKLFSPNCISCTTRQRPNSTRNYSRSKIDMSIDEPSLDQIKNSMYIKGSY